MSVRDPKFTLRIEGALRKLARIPQVSLGYVARAADIDIADLQAWTDEFCAGDRKQITHARIDEVKRELGSLAESEIEQVIEQGLLNAGPVAPDDAKAPNGELAGARAARESAEPSATPRALFKKPKQFHRAAYLRHRSTYLFVAENPELSQSEACRRLKVQLSAWSYHARSLFGGSPTPEMIRAYIAWADEQVKGAPAENPIKPKTMKDSAPNKPIDKPTRSQASAQVDAVSTCSTGGFITFGIPRAAASETIFARHEISLGRVEIVVRLLPPGGGS